MKKPEKHPQTENVEKIKTPKHEPILQSQPPADRTDPQETQRQQWLNTINETLNRRGFSPAEIQYKAFNQSGEPPFERYAIEKRTDPEGNPIVVKTAQTDDEYSTQALQHEHEMLQAASIADREISLTTRAQIEGKLCTFGVESVRTMFAEGQFQYMLTDYQENDPRLDEKLTPAEKLELFDRTIQYVAALQTGKLPDQRSRLTEDIPASLKRKDLLAASTLERVAQLNEEVLDEAHEYPLVAVHGDLHASNIQKVLAGERIAVTVMDLEDLHLGSQFEEHARLYARARVLQKVRAQIPDLENNPVIKQTWILDLADDPEAIKLIALSRSDNQERAARYFDIWTTNVLLEQLNFHSSVKHEFYQAAAKAEHELIDELMLQFAREEIPEA